MTSEEHAPYWKRAHRDWRVRVAAVIMVAAMVVYVLTENLALRPGMHRLPPATPVVK